MNSPGLTASELLRPPGFSARRDLQLSGRWWTDLCLYLQAPVGALGSIGWPMVLLPELVDRRFRLAEDSLQTYHRVTWGAEMPTTSFSLDSQVAWVSARNSSLELGVATRALAGEAELARSLLVARTTGTAESWGERDVPRVPDAGNLSRRRSLIIDEHQVRRFAELAGTRYPIHDDLHYAWQKGYPNVLVQALVLLIIQLHVAGAGAAGAVEMWFRRAVPAGSLLELCRSDDDPGVWAFRSVATGEVAAVGRLANEGSVI
jgi:hypothetical protein